MRHTYASMMLMAGESPQWVATQMGHTDWTFTARTYTRFIPDDAPDAGKKAVERWGIAGNTSLLRSTSAAVRTVEQAHLYFRYRNS